jgi:hypothetical protein
MGSVVTKNRYLTSTSLASRTDFNPDCSEVIDVGERWAGENLLANPCEKAVSIVPIQHGSRIKSTRLCPCKCLRRNLRTSHFGGTIDAVSIGRKCVNPGGTLQCQREGKAVLGVRTANAVARRVTVNSPPDKRKTGLAPGARLA